MDYFRLEQKRSGSLSVTIERKEPDSVIAEVEGWSELTGIDYVSQKRVVSDRLKRILDSFLPKQVWEPYVFVDRKQKEQEVFWNLNLEECHPEKTWFDETGLLAGMQIREKGIPRMFLAIPEKGNAAVILHLSVVEALLRRGILGITVVPVLVSVLDPRDGEEKEEAPIQKKGEVVEWDG